MSFAFTGLSAVKCAKITNPYSPIVVHCVMFFFVEFIGEPHGVTLICPAGRVADVAFVILPPHKPDEGFN